MSVEKITSQPSLHNLDLQIKKDDKEYEIQQETKEVVAKEEFAKMVNSINEFLQLSNTHLKFQLHEKLNEYYVTIVDNHTEEVIREIPPRKWLDIYAAMTEFIGLVVDKKI